MPRLNISVLRLSVLTAVLIVCSCGLRAQTDAQFSQFYEVPSYFNPSAIGNSDYLRIRGGARLQWVGIDNAPTTFMAVADMPFKLGSRRLATGINLQQESIGLYKTLALGAQIAYKLRKLGGEFSFGLQVGMYDQSFRGTKVYIPDNDDYHQSTDDAIPTTDIHGTALDLAAGVRYNHRLFHAGLSCTHLTSPRIAMNAENSSGGSETASGRRYEFQARRTLYFEAGCNIPIKNTLFELAPALLVRTDFTFTGGEAMARLRWRKMFTIGIGYRWDDAITAALSAEIKNFFIGYSFDYATTALRSASSGSHELFAGYSLKLDLGDKNRHRHKSVRIM